MTRLPDALTGDLLVILCAAVMLLTTIARADGTSSDGPGASTPDRLRLVPDNLHDVTLTEIEDGCYEVVTLGRDPYVFVAPFRERPDLKKRPVLSFEYFTTTPTNSIQVYFTPPAAEDKSIAGEGLTHSEGWTTYSLDLSQNPGAWTHEWRRLRLDFGDAAGRTLQIRHIVLREPNARERERAATRDARREAASRLEHHLRAYLQTDYPCAIHCVSVSEDTVTVTGDTGEETGELYLCESPLYEHLTETTAFARAELLQGAGPFRMAVSRYVPLEDRRYDRLLSRWVVARKVDDTYALLSHGRYADSVAPLHDLPRVTPFSKKGLGGFSAWGRGPVSDLDELGIASVTVNIWLNFMRMGPGENHLPFESNEKTYYVDANTIHGLDLTLLEAARRGIVVSAILLVPKAESYQNEKLGNIFEHPDCDPAGIYSMANVTSDEGIEYYAAALDFLARRYTRPDAKFGRIHHWIVHNEVDAGWVWTNAGEKTALLYMDQYHKSMRTAHLIGRKYCASLQTFISLTHSWTATEDRRFYRAAELLDLLLAFSKAEGDFEWALAYHPYPESLYNPRTWEDRVDFTLRTPWITYKNLEVLAMWARQPHTYYQGVRKRVIHLSEQGLNAKDYSEDALLDQAAGMAYAWKKCKDLSEIEAFHYHNWIDNRHEGGLRIGLRKFPDDEHEPWGPKPIFHLYRALGTPEEDAACAFALERIGLDTWDALLQHPASPSP